jgi:hypothetical protein
MPAKYDDIDGLESIDSFHIQLKVNTQMIFRFDHAA